MGGENKVKVRITHGEPLPQNFLLLDDFIVRLRKLNKVDVSSIYTGL